MAITYHAGRRIQAISADAVTATNFGTIDTTSSPNNTIITFTKSGTFAPTSAFDVEYLVVAGGGSGGDDSGGGGGAGGFRTDTAHGVTAQSYSITVGDGSTVATDDPNVAGGNGADSIFDTITSTGGGGGASNSDGQAGVFGNGKHGGSGGGAGGGGTNTGVHVVGSGNTPSTTPSQGNNGGLNVSSGSFPNRGGGGGGGAGVVGSPSTGNNGGAGGNGKANPIVGSTSGQLSGGVYYLSGGGGGAGGTAASASGGLGGGGASTTTTSVSGSPNTGGGGGASIAGQPSVSGAGGSGIVIIKFVTSGNTYTIEGVTNAQVGSRFEETDTRKMYHKLDVTGADLSLSELKAYWKFNESSGDIVNQAISVGSTDGLGTTASNLQIAGADYDQTGITANNKSLYFDGSDHGQAGTSASQFNFLHTPNTKWTINFWLKYGGDTTGNTILDTNGGGGTARVGLLIDVLADESMQVWMGRGVATTTVVSTNSGASFVPSDSAFHFYSIRYDHTLASSNVKISIDNGTPVTGNKTSDTPSSADSAFPFNIAENCNGYGAFLDGNLTEMSIWNRVLTDAEVTTIYNSGSGKRIGDSWKEEGT